MTMLRVMLAVLFAGGLVVGAMVAVSCSEGGGTTVDASAEEGVGPQDDAVTVTYSLPPMHCVNCSNSIVELVSKEYPGVEVLENDFNTKLVVMRMAPDQQAAVTETLDAASWEPAVVRVVGPDGTVLSEGAGESEGGDGEVAPTETSPESAPEDE